jgi:hypothetical protein
MDFNGSSLEHIPHFFGSNFQVNTHQYSATSFERDLGEGSQGDTPEGIHVQHGTNGVPGTALLIACVYPPFLNS